MSTLCKRATGTATDESCQELGGVVLIYDQATLLCTRPKIDHRQVTRGGPKLTRWLIRSQQVYLFSKSKSTWWQMAKSITFLSPFVYARACSAQQICHLSSLLLVIIFMNRRPAMGQVLSELYIQLTTRVWCGTRLQLANLGFLTC